MGSFKDKIRNNFWGNYLISISHCVRCKIEPALISDEKAVKKYYKKKSGKELNLNNPQTFSEKLNWYKLNDRNPLMAQCADKVAVREYVTEKGYAHCSHMNYIVKDKKTFDWKHAKKMMKTWLHQDIYWSGREWVYKDIPKRIIIEKYLEDETGELRDFKFFCFDGKPYYMQTDIGRNNGIHYRNYYDITKSVIDCCDNARLPNNKDIPFPIDTKIFNEMVLMCENLAKPFSHVRVDYYLVEGKIYFGELTFFDGGGSTFFYPEQWNYKFSEKWIIKSN